MQASKFRVLVVDDYTPWRSFVVLALTSNTRTKIVGEAGDGTTAIQRVTENQPDLVVLDIGLPDMTGFEVAQNILAIAPKTKVLFLTEECSHEFVKKALSTGAHGYVLKSEAARDLVPAVTALLMDDYFVSLRAVASRASDGSVFGPQDPGD